MKNEEGIHVLARAIMIYEEKLLVTTDIKRNVSFLPGGHIHHGEKAKDALKREISEELGIDVQVGKFLGMIEAGWDYKGELYHEYNLLFDIQGLNHNMVSKIQQMESDLNVDWVPIDEVNQLNIFPIVLRENIKGLVRDNSSNLFESEWTFKK